MIINASYQRSQWEGAVRDWYCGPFDETKRQYQGIFYPELSLIVIESGLNRAAVSIKQELNAGKATLLVSERCLSLCFPYFVTDGLYWHDKRDEEERREPVTDVRFALLYNLAREIWLHQNGQPSIFDPDAKISKETGFI